MKYTSAKTILTCAFFLALVGAFYSCRKTGPADALVIVTDSIGAPVQGANVVLEQDSVVSPNTGAQAIIHQEGVTDYSGQAKFTFELEAVLNVEVTKGALLSRDFIRLEQSKQVEKTIILK
jgi:hypothetical protein